MRKLALLVFGVALAAVAGLAGAADLKEGAQYTVFRPPQPTESKDKVEVTEFFWYGCSHCFHLEPGLEKWMAKLPRDVAFRRVPAVFPGRDGGPGPWGPAAKLYYALETMGQAERLQATIFRAVQVERLRLIGGDDSELFGWVAKQGIDAKQFGAIYNSFAVQSKVRRAMQLTAAFGLDGVPALVVDGRYLAMNLDESGEITLANVSQLIEMARKARVADKK